MRVFALCTLLLSSALAEPVPVKIVPGQGITREGRPYFVKGAGGSKYLAELAAAGGNSVRTWSTDGLAEFLDEAQSRGLTVCVGIWLEPECSWFSYSKPEHCARQLERVKKEVGKFKDHPAVLFWGLGNEAEGDGKNAAYWKQLEVLAKAVKELDPAHPTFTAVAGLQPAKIEGLNTYTPSLDFVGINTYGALPALREYLKREKWTRPWVVTEYGPRGFWESPKTSWGAPVEQTSTEKAQGIKKAYERAIQPGGDCWGSYAFLWGQKQEATATWFGIFTKTGESTATKDVLQELWTGKPPQERAPRIKSVNSEVAKKELAAGQKFTATAEASDPDDDALTWVWSVTPEDAGHGQNGRPREPKPLPDCLLQQEGNSASFQAPAKPGAYRVHVLITDTRKRAATANFPILVK